MLGTTRNPDAEPAPRRFTRSDRWARADVVRTNNTVITVTLDAEAAYDITATETITVTVPAVMITGNFPLVGSPTFTITAVGGVTIKYTQLEHAFLRGAFRGIALGVR